jgi:hypothetical protein
MHLQAERFVFSGWWSRFSKIGSQGLSNGSNVASWLSNAFFFVHIYSLWFDWRVLIGPYLFFSLSNSLQLSSGSRRRTSTRWRTRWARRFTTRSKTLVAWRGTAAALGARLTCASWTPTRTRLSTWTGLWLATAAGSPAAFKCVFIIFPEVFVFETFKAYHWSERSLWSYSLSACGNFKPLKFSSGCRNVYR